ncbi:MAG TPA: hypothetical protein VL981_00525 [Candidatus Methylacidiphilales bacterium]|nr:hypothetical protein [Candidatus Methylacidiphilales bacterium]
MAGLLFTRLGHYALWDDEAGTALVAKGILRTGDTSVILDHGNICAYRSGIDIRDFCDRGMPPLSPYVTAASFLLFGVNAWAARLPYALLGLATVGLILFWARRERWLVLLVLSLGLLGNVSLILFLRQGRYYALTIFLSVAIAFVYWHGKATPRNLLILAGLSILLFLSNYLNYLALYVCLAVDYILWKRKEWPFSWGKVLLLFGPQILLNGLAASIWNPFLTQHGGYETKSSLFDRFILFYWYWRDMNASEFMAIPLVFLALGFSLAQRRLWLVRGCVISVIYIMVVAFIAPQVVDVLKEADIRYTSPVIPLDIALETGAICLVFQHRSVLAILLALIVFGTNLLNGGPLLDCGFRSTLVSYIGELIHPVPEPYTPTANWINEHVPEGASIWVEPGYAPYPLMFHAPRALYAWQLMWPPRPDFAHLPIIYFAGQKPPDYLITFGPWLDVVMKGMQLWNRPDARYTLVTTIPVFWKDCYRPELIWHKFEPIRNFDLQKQAVYIFQRVAPPPK